MRAREETQRDDSKIDKDEEGDRGEVPECEEIQDRALGGAKRGRSGAPAFSDEDEMEIIEFVQAHTVLYAKEHVHYVDKTKKDKLWEEIV